MGGEVRSQQPVVFGVMLTVAAGGTFGKKMAKNS